VVLAGLGAAGAEPPPPPPPPTVAEALLAIDPDLYADLSDEEILARAQAAGQEVIVVWDERPEKPFDRDTRLRLGEADLAGRGVTHLAAALADLPDVVVRAMGRGGQQIDIRGARKAAVKVLVDGVALEDPYYGTFDLSSVAVTDVVQVRIATSPASPIDGPGGPGGVVEVHTRDAVGTRAVIAQVSGDSLPTAAAAATGRAPLGRHLAARVSATGTLGLHTYELPAGAIDEERHLAGGAARLEWRPPGQAERRAVVDVAAQSRAFLAPPSQDEMALLRIHGEESLRAGARFEDRLGALRLAAGVHGTVQHRDASYYSDLALAEQTNREDLTARRAGAALLVNRAVGRRLQLVAAAHLTSEDAQVIDARDNLTAGRSMIGELASGAQLARGPVRLDGAVGVALPVGVGHAPWPEGKLTAGLTPVEAVTISATVGRKGRLPTLRERYRLDVGNAALDPELASFAEVRVAVTPSAASRLESASWVRRQSGMILLDREARMLTNLGTIDLRGIDTSFEVRPHRRLALRGAWSFTEADDASAEPPLDFLPRHRLSARATVAAGARVTAGTRVAWIAAQLDRNTTLPARTEWDLYLALRPSGGWLLSARLDDVLDARWPLRAGVPSAGRTLMLAAQATFE
jgi:outer membrane receptor protein involved in Fe transport